MSKKEVRCIDNTGELQALDQSLDAAAAQAKTLLEALSPAQRAEVLKGFKKQGTAKEKGPNPKEEFNKALAKMGEKAFGISAMLSAFPGPVAVTFEKDPDGVHSVSVKRIRNKYGPRKGKA